MEVKLFSNIVSNAATRTVSANPAPSVNRRRPSLAGRQRKRLDSRSCLKISATPAAAAVIDAEVTFSWGAWVSLSGPNFKKTLDLIDTAGRESEPPSFGWLATELPLYPVATLNLKTNLHTRPVGLRPTIELEPTDHPLAIEQRNGITLERVRQIAEEILHPGT